MVRVAMGGTFEVVHKGHRALLAKAFALALGDQVLIGLTSDHLANSTRSRMVLPYRDREIGLRAYLERKYPGCDYEIAMIGDEFGPAAHLEDLEVLVVSEFTYPTGVRLNEHREAKGLRSLQLVKIGQVLADDGKPISSTRVLAGECDVDGRILSS
ncbi:MAG: pantetheine-phosphate adenylyltransferase [Thermoplasmata archaeon]|nr:MAG: pantetheine-phosphate adenylyltransferase [Thermoplasmata archaeon]